MKFYAKEIPRGPIYMPNGDAIQFDTVDGRTGYYATDREDYITWFTKLIAEHRGGISEVDQAAYDEFSKKKQASPPYVYQWTREEFPTSAVLSDTVMSRAAVAAGSSQGPVGSVDTGKPAETVVPAKAPRIGKRVTEGGA